MASYKQEKHCCTVCDKEQRCSVCGNQTDYACADCYMNFGCTATIYVCATAKCRDAHELLCGGPNRRLDAARER